MRALFDKGWKRLVAFYNRRLVVGLFYMEQEEFDYHFRSSLHGAKALSDFVAMIVRLGFAQFSFVYFSHMAYKTEGIYRLVYGFCGTGSLGIVLILFFRISMVIFLWEVSGIIHVRAGLAKLMLLLIATVSTMMIYMGTYHLVTDLALASKLLGPPSAPG